MLIIDGQQRLTTISILILAGLNAVVNGDMENGGEDLDKIREYYLYAPLRKHVDRNIKLRPIEEDMKAYDALFTNDIDNFVRNSGVTINYELFYRSITVSNITFADMIKAIERLIVIDIRLDSKDNPQLIFESLNSCGKDLEEADKVRNYLLMSLSSDKQEDYYYTYWSKIETLTDGEPTMFIRDYLTVKSGVISKLDELYFDFKKYDEDNYIEREQLLSDMLVFARYYRQIVKGESGSIRLDRKLKQIASLDSTVHLPFLMSFFEYSNIHDIHEDEIYAVLDIIEGYWARRIICNYPTNALQKMFAILHHDIIKIFSRNKKAGRSLDLPYSNILNHMLLHKQGTVSFPTDMEVKENFATRQVYKMPSSHRYFLFERMENENSPEADDHIVDKMKEGRISIEHIMPQTLTPQWKQELGENWEEIHERYLHTFANLTLTGFNTAYSNHPFKEKKEGYIDRKGQKINGFDNSAFCLSNYLKQCSTWTLNEIEERQKLLTNNFLHLWPMITSSYQPLEKEYELVSFDDEEYELTNRQIMGYRYRDIRHRVSTWKEMLIQVCKLMYDENPSTMLFVAGRDLWIHTSGSKDRSKIADGCFVYSSCSTNTKRSILTFLFKETGIPSSILEFELVPMEGQVYDNTDTLEN